MTQPLFPGPDHGSPITMGKDGKLQVPERPDHPVHRGRRHRAATSGAPRVRVLDAAVAKAYGGKRKIAWMEVYAGEKAFKQFNNWLPDETVEALPRVPGRHQGPADHADRRRHPLAQRRAAPAARPLRLPAPGALVQGRALAGEAPGEGRHGDLPREHRGHLRRHRVRGRARDDAKKFLALPRAELPEGLQEDPLPGHDRHRHQAGVAGGHRAPGPRGDRVRDRATSARASRSCTRATS